MHFRIGSAGSSRVRVIAVLTAGVALASLGTAGLADDPPARQEAAAPASFSTRELIAFLDPGLNAGSFADAHGLELLYGLRSDPNAFVFSAGSAARAQAFTQQAVSGVRWSALNTPAQAVRMFFPNDPYFPRDGGEVGQPGQWHLVNQHVADLDAGVQGAWAMGYTGAGVTIGIVDDSLEIAHEDLAPNVMLAHSWDFGSNDADPSPVNTGDAHGISVAGVAGARGGNGIGVTGAAPFSGLAGLRINFPTQTSQMFIDATLFHSSGSDTSIKIKNHSYGYSVTYASSSGIIGEQTALSTSADAGTIHVIAAGNARGNAPEDSNKLDLQNHPEGITVAALGNHGAFASYSSFGANVFVTAPSSSNSISAFFVTTTDRTGSGGWNDFPGDDRYTDIFGGTSSAAPLVAGVLALVKEAQPNLDVRFAKHLLARTSVIVDPGDATATSDGGWRTNAAGFTFNQNYGFGMINAEALVQQAVLYQGVTPLETFSSGTLNVNQAIPDSNLTGITRAFNVTSSGLLEEVLITLGITHTGRGDIEAYLTSPMGTTGRIVYRSSPDGGDNINNWQFTSNAFWGEDPLGQWSLMVRDVFFPADLGTWNSWSINLNMGTLVVPEPGASLLLLGGALLLLGRRRSVAVCGSSS